MSKPKLSVRLMTYMHEPFISKAMDGIMMQETNFDIEVVVGDDFSTDRTLDIIRSYKNTERISIKILEREIGGEYWKKRKKLGRLYNFSNIIENCKGEYIALLDGDDYWTDTLKLQKQVDFLDNNLTYSICFHRVEVLFKNKIQKNDITERRFSVLNSNSADFYQLLEFGNFIHTPSAVIRTQNSEFPMEFYKSSIGDYFYYLLQTQGSLLYRLEDKMAVYRKGVGLLSTYNLLENNMNILKYQICLLSYLNDSNANMILLNKIFSKVDRINKNLKRNRFKNIINRILDKF